MDTWIASSTASSVALAVVLALGTMVSAVSVSPRGLLVFCRAKVASRWKMLALLMWRRVNSTYSPSHLPTHCTHAHLGGARQIDTECAVRNLEHICNKANVMKWLLPTPRSPTPTPFPRQLTSVAKFVAYVYFKLGAVAQGGVGGGDGLDVELTVWQRLW